MNLFVAELCFLKNLRFQLELDKFLQPFALQQDFRAFLVNRDAELVFLGEKEGVRPRSEVEAKLLQQNAQLRGLVRRKRVSVRVHPSRGRTSNVQRSTSNAQSQNQPD